jgi:hypothetical protein
MAVPPGQPWGLAAVVALAVVIPFLDGIHPAAQRAAVAVVGQFVLHGH